MIRTLEATLSGRIDTVEHAGGDDRGGQQSIKNPDIGPRGATVWVITEGLDTFVIDMFHRTDYTLVDFNGDRVTCAFTRRFDADD